MKAGTFCGEAVSPGAEFIRAASRIQLYLVALLRNRLATFRLHASDTFGRRWTGASVKKIHIKRIYEPPTASDGTRILVDRLWPRGVARDGARIDAWIKDVAPSDVLRRWYSHDPEKWPEFRARYIAELKHNPAVVELQDMAAKSKTLTLLFAAKDNLRNNATVLQEFLRGGAAAE